MKPRSRARDWILPLAIALSFRTLVASAYEIPSESMLPTLQVGDRIVVEKISKHARAPKRGEIVVFEHPQSGETLVKRVGAVAGEEAMVRGRIERVPDGALYMLGDNRDNSSDSRTWGMLPLDKVIGRAVGVLWSRGPDGMRWSRWLSSLDTREP